jgi:hypothetical protein
MLLLEGRGTWRSVQCVSKAKPLLWLGFSETPITMGNRGKSIQTISMPVALRIYSGPGWESLYPAWD